MDQANQIRRLCLLFSFCGAFSLLWLCNGCKGPPPPPPDKNKVLWAFGVYNVPKPSDSTPTPLPSVDVYIDDSESMRGFVADNDSTYSQVIGKILNSVTTASYPSNIYRLSSQTTLGDSSPSNWMFYNGTDTPLVALLTKIASNMEQNQNMLSVVVSDLVQSEKGTDHRLLVKAFQKIATRHPDVLLMAFRSNFRGTYWTETSLRRKFPLNLPSKDESGQGRPFYLLVIAPSEKALKQFQQYVLRGLGEAESFQPTAPPLEVERVEFVPPKPPLRPIWNRSGELGLLSGMSNSTGRIGTFVERETPQGEVSPLRLRLIVQQPHIPLVSPTSFSYQVGRTTFQMGKAKQLTSSTLQPTVGKNPDGCVFTVTYPFSRPKPYTWDVYRIQMRAGEGNLKVPDWVQEWSTDDDQSPEKGDRTLHLNLLVEAMVRAITEKVVLLDQFILLGRGG